MFILVATLGPALPVAIYFALGARAKHVLDELKLWLGANNAAIMAVLCLVIGAKLIGDGISGLRDRLGLDARPVASAPRSPRRPARSRPAPRSGSTG